MAFTGELALRGECARHLFSLAATTALAYPE